MPNPDPIKQVIRADYDGKPVEDAARDMKDLGDTTKKAGDQSEQTGKQTKSLSESSGVLGRVTQFATGAMASLAATLSGTFGLNALMSRYNEHIRANNQLLERNAQLARDSAQARLDLAALSGAETPEDVAFLDRASAFSGRSQAEVARLTAQFKSALPDANKQQIESLVSEVSSFGQITPAPLSSLAPAFLSIYRLTGDARVSGNLLKSAIDQAGESDPAKLGREIEKFVGVATQIGGLDAATAVGFGAAGTGLGLPNEIATTGLKNVIFALRGKGTPDGVKVLERENIPRENLIEGLLAIQAAVESGRISPAELEALGGREAAPVFAALSKQDILDAFLAKVEAVRATESLPGRLSEQTAEGIVESSQVQGLNLLAKQQEVQAENIKASDLNALRVQAARRIVERLISQRQAEGKLSGAQGEAVLEEFDRLTSLERVSSVLQLGEIAQRASGSGAGFVERIIGANGSGGFQDTQFRREVIAGLGAGPETSVDRAFGVTIINNGTIINQAGDPNRDDLEEGRPVN